MRPKRPEEFFSAIMGTFWMRLYGDITEAARRKRLTEYDIAGIERRVLADLYKSKDLAADFPEFDATAVSQVALREIHAFLDVTRKARAEKIAQEH